jgi:hypothetical protein
MTSGISYARSYRTLRDGSFEGRFPRHFVPGYDRTVPPGHTGSAEISKLHQALRAWLLSCCPSGTKTIAHRSASQATILLGNPLLLEAKRFQGANGGLHELQAGVPLEIRLHNSPESERGSSLLKRKRQTKTGLTAPANFDG